MFDDIQTRPWMKWSLRLAALHNVLWGLVAVLATDTSLAWAGFESVSTTGQLMWQSIGMMVGSYGVGYWIAARDPYRFWPIVLIGLLWKVFGPLGYLLSAAYGTVPEGLGLSLLANDLIWWLPFGAILWGAMRFNQAQGTAHVDPEYDDPLRELKTNSGQSLAEMSEDQPQLVVLLRHAGCTFCRESVADIREQKQQIEATGCGIVFVHPGADGPSRNLFERNEVEDLPRISDPECRLYRQFGLEVGGFRQLFGLRVWTRGVMAGLVRGHGIGRTESNSFQMPGAFVIDKGRFVRGFRHESASDRPDYVSLARTIHAESESAAPTSSPTS